MKYLIKFFCVFLVSISQIYGDCGESLYKDVGMHFNLEFFGTICWSSSDSLIKM